MPSSLPWLYMFSTLVGARMLECGVPCTALSFCMTLRRGAPRCAGGAPSVTIGEALRSIFAASLHSELEAALARLDACFSLGKAAQQRGIAGAWNPNHGPQALRTDPHWQPPEPARAKRLARFLLEVRHMERGEAGSSALFFFSGCFSLARPCCGWGLQSCAALPVGPSRLDPASGNPRDPPGNCAVCTAGGGGGPGRAAGRNQGCPLAGWPGRPRPGGPHAACAARVRLLDVAGAAGGGAGRLRQGDSVWLGRRGAGGAL